MSKQIGERFVITKQQNQRQLEFIYTLRMRGTRSNGRRYRSECSSEPSSKRLNRADRPLGASTASFQASVNRIPTTGIAPSHDGGAANPASSMIEIRSTRLGSAREDPKAKHDRPEHERDHVMGRGERQYVGC